MNFTEFILKRPIMTFVLSIIITLFGIIGFTFLGVREYPALDPPIITVSTSYVGANADVIEYQITEPLEKSINGIAGIRTISSSSNMGSSNITVEFNLGTDLEAAANDVRDKVSQAMRLLPPDLTTPPIVTKADANSDAIITLTLQSDTKNILEVTDYGENVLMERLQTIPGVSTIQVWGEKRFAMRIWIDPPKLAAFGLTPLDINSALELQNVELPSGKVTGNNTELTVRTYGLLKTPEEFNNLILKTQDNKNIRLRDVGHAEYGAENEETSLKAAGIPMIGLALVPQPGSNYIEIADEFYKRYENLKKEIPADYKMNIAVDNTKFIRQSVSEVKDTLLIAIVLVVVIIYLFFREWIIAFRPLIDIPVSLIGAFFVMYIFGFSINILTLLAIVLATGLVVDDGIVVTENIYKRIERGMKPMDAAREGTNEIFFAVISTSLTLAIVFLPIIFLQGFIGRLFREFGIVLGGAVLISAFVSLTLTPVLNVKLASKDHHKRSWFYNKTEPFFVWLMESYRTSLFNFFKRRWWAFVIIAVALITMVVMTKLLQQELSPLEDRSMLRLVAIAPEGATFDYMQNYMDRITSFIDDSVPEKQIALTITAPGFSGGSVNGGAMRIMLYPPDKRKRSQQNIADYLTKNMSRFPEGRAFVSQEQTISVGSGAARSGLPVQFVLQAQSFDKLREYLPKFLEEASKNPTFRGLDWNLKFNKPELGLAIDRDKANSLGVSIKDIAETLELSLSGVRLSYFNMNGKQYQVIGQADRANRDKPLDLKSLYVRNKAGELIQLDNLMKMTEQSNPPQLYHFNRYKSATISAGLAEGKTIGDGITEMNKIAKKVLDDTFSTALTGPSRDFAESSSNILFALVLALVLIYLILSAQFESFRDPLIIMFTVPLALASALFSLWYFNQTLNIFSEIGIILLIGLVTKNGILIVEFANQQKDKGLNLHDAALEASVMRLRPILMTSIATALGALPIALGLGAGAQSRIPMGIVVIGGLLLSLVLTLYVIPTMYTFLSKEKHVEEEIEYFQ